MSKARDKANIPSLNFSSTGIDDNATSTAITINSSESVGIGETSPLAKLHVKIGDSGASANAGGNEVVVEDSAGAGISILTGNTSKGQIIFGDDGDDNAGRLVYDHSDNNLASWTNGSERMRIDSSGRVGIGTTAPFNSTAGSFTISNTAPAIFLEDTDSSSWGVGRFIFSNGILSYLVGLRNGTGTSGSEERFRIDSSGNVGIGTTSPSDTANRVTLELNDTWGGRIRNSNGGTANSEWSISTSNMALFGTIVSQPLAFTTNNLERMRINSDGAVSIASTNVTQNSHFNVRQDDNTHATRTYLQARVGSGALYSIKYLGTIPAVSLGTQLIIPFISQNNIGSKTYVHIRGMSCESNTTNPKAFDVKFSVGHTTTLSNLTVLQNLGTCTGASISGMNIVLAFSVDYTHSGDSGMFIEIDYIAHHQDGSINLSGIVMN